MSKHDWGSAVGNLENARAAFDTLTDLLLNAIYLDGDAFNNARETSILQQKVQALRQRKKILEEAVQQLQEQLHEKDMQLAKEIEMREEVQKQNEEYKRELDNNSVVFKMHFEELLARHEEIEKLKATIEELREKVPTAAADTGT